MEITLRRTVCYGFCPAYTVTITGDGAVRYVGERFVNVVGPASATIPREDVAALLARFDEIGFDQLDDEYRGMMTDLPTTTITLVRNGRRKSLVDYGGTSVGMPRAVRDLQAEIDRVAGTAQTGTTVGIDIYAGAGSVIENNRVAGDLGGTAAVGINISQSTDVLVAGNHVTSADSGIAFSNATGKYTGNLTSGVTIPFNGGTAVGTNN